MRFAGKRVKIVYGDRFEAGDLSLVAAFRIVDLGLKT